MDLGRNNGDDAIKSMEKRLTITSDELVNDILPENDTNMSLKVMDFGIRASYVVLGIILLVLVGIIIYLMVSMSTIKITSLAEDQLRIYKETRVVVMDEALKLGDQFLLKLLLPVLTLLLGYVLGRERK